MKQKYYRVEKIKKLNAQYNMLLGERSNGKSYAVKEDVLAEAWNEGIMFAYLRRWQVDLKQISVEAYFADAPVKAITGGECNAVTLYRSVLYFSNIDEEGNVERVKACGRALYLSGAVHYKSQAFPNYGNIIFEEFATVHGYLPDELTYFDSIVSTVARREGIRVWMVANTVSRICPYFQEWQLVNIPNQKQGTIDVYHYTTDQFNEDGTPVIVDIAVEFCENSGNNSKMFFGARSKAITTGSWDCKAMPKLPDGYDKFENGYNILISRKGFNYIGEVLIHKESQKVFFFVHPAGKNRNRWPMRQIVEEITAEVGQTYIWEELTRGDVIAKQLVRAKAVVYSDNLTGTEFEEVVKEIM